MEAKTGVFLCDCGRSLKNIDFARLRRRAATLPGVAYTELRSDLCLKGGLEAMVSALQREGIERAVIAACSPQAKGQVFSKALQQAGLDSNLISWANLREQCSWAHDGDVTPKALSLMEMAARKARLLSPLKKAEIPVNQRALIIGGGFSGMKAALELSQLGIKATLVERESGLGGRLKEIESIYGLEPSQREMVSSLAKRTLADGNIEVLTGAQVIGVEGAAGDFKAEIKRNGERLRRNFGAIVLASGYQAEALPDAEKSGNIIPLAEFSRLLDQEPCPASVAFVVDVSNEHARLPALSALSNALVAKERLGSEVYVFLKNLKVDTQGAEKLYREAREKGVVFLKFEGKPQVSSNDGGVRITAKDVLLGDEVTLDCDLLVMEEKALPSAELASTLRVGTDPQGFYQEVNPHLLPVSSSRKGVVFAGNCRSDLDFARAAMEAADAALQVYDLLSRGRVAVEVDRVKVDPDKCRVCLTCVRVCPHGAIGLEHLRPDKESARIYDLACDACGVCVAICPAKAINYEGYSDEQILAEIEEVGAS